MGRVIVITSGKGGVGKTTTTANVGTALAMLGKKVVLVDTDIGLRNLDVVLGLENRIVYDIVDAVRGNCRLKQALIKDKRLENLYLLPAAQTKDKTAVTTEQMVELCEKLKEEFDYVVIDCPAGIEHGFKNAIAGAEPKLIINRIRTNMVRTGDMMGVDDILDILAIGLLGIVPDDDAIVISTNRGEPTVFDDNSRPGRAFRNIARRIEGEDVPLMNLEEKQGFFGRLKHMLKAD